MRDYEALFILKTKKDEEKVEKTISSIIEVIKKNKGKILKEDNWGKRFTAYPINKQKEGIFYRVDFSADPSTLRNIEGAYKLNSDILRTMVVKREA